MNFYLKQFKNIKESFDDSNCIELTEEAYLKYQDILLLLEQRGYIHNVNADNKVLYYKKVSFGDFEVWLKAQIKENKRMKRRDWIVAIVSTLTGALIGLIPTFINLFN